VVYVGTCGYSYKEWSGPFYPATIRQPEMLRYYAAAFRAVEIDASSYGVLSPQTVARMNARTPAHFRFCFKAPQTVTHASDGAMNRLHDDAHAFVKSVAPIVQAEKFGCALLQFPNAFHPNERTADYLRRVVDAMHGLPVVVEFRNAQWQTPEYLELARDLGVGWCNVDMPRYETLMRPSTEVTSAIGYVRFHGRNAAQWWTGDNRTRYDYNYSADELIPWANRVAEIDEQVEATYAFFNNHARGNAARNAETFLRLLGAETPARPAQESLFD
jgi:uncharacterized protein YecE (DUF72 family)